jgi:hypothetical protein
MANATHTTTGTSDADVRPFNRELSNALDRLILQLEQGNPGRWTRRILKLRKLVAEHRALGGAK